MRYINQMVVLNQHAKRLREEYNILLQIKSNATKVDISDLDAKLNLVQDEISSTISAIGVLNGLV